MKDHTQVHKTGLFILVLLAVASTLISVNNWVLSYFLGTVFLLPAIGSTLSAVVFVAMWFFAVKMNHDQAKIAQSNLIREIAIKQENIKLRMTMIAWILAMRALRWKSDEVASTLDAFDKVVHEKKVPADLKPIIEQLVKVGREVRRKSND